MAQRDLLARHARGQPGEGAGMRLEGVDIHPGRESEQGLGIGPHIGTHVEHDTALDLWRDFAEEALLRRAQTVLALVIDRDAIAAQREIIDRSGEPRRRGPVHRPYQRIGRQGQPSLCFGW